MYSYNRQKLVCSNFPIIPSIELSSKCDLNCVFCGRASVNQRGLGFMSDKTFNNIVNPSNAWILRHLRLNVHGESLLHPRVVEYVRRSKQYSETVGFSTNGLKLTKDMSKQLLEAGLRTISVSFEGTDKQTYEKLRRGSNYDTVKRNLLDFIALKNELKSTCILSIAIIDTPETHAKLNDFIRYWSFKGVDTVQVLKLHDWGGVHDWGDASKGLTGSTQEVCFWAWYGLYILYDGTVSPCCVYEPKVGEGMVPLGNVNDNTIEEIWNSKAYQWFRHSHANGRFMNLRNGKHFTTCQTCKIANLGIGRHDYLDVIHPSLHTLSRQLFHYGVWLTKRTLARVVKPKPKTVINIIGR